MKMRDLFQRDLSLHPVSNDEFKSHSVVAFASPEVWQLYLSAGNLKLAHQQQNKAFPRERLASSYESSYHPTKILDRRAPTIHVIMNVSCFIAVLIYILAASGEYLR